MTRRGAHLRLQSQGNERLTVQVGDTVKSRLRSELRARRQAIAPGQRKVAALRAARHFLRHRRLAGARCVALYLKHGSELDTGPLIEVLRHSGRTVLVPRTRDDRTLRLVRLGTKVRRSRYGIRVPAAVTPRALVRQIDVILLPLLGFDDAGRRLGTGGGYYDRLLARPRIFRRPLLLGYAYAAQRHDELPEDQWDRRLDGVVTERGLTWFRNR
jgi:5-formyltetrahydrofolate cyclo-ligase